ncbi:MAG: hypothetical protein ACFB0C_03035 [Leptolyngbyaceae cyanobacterium]
MERAVASCAKGKYEFNEKYSQSYYSILSTASDLTDAHKAHSNNAFEFMHPSSVRSLQEKTCGHKLGIGLVDENILQ